MQTEEQSQQESVDVQSQEATGQAAPASALDALVDELDEMSSPDGAVAAGTEYQQTQEAQPQEPHPQQPVDQRQEAQQPDELEPPQHWPEEQKELFRAQTPEARRFLLERHRQMEGDYTRKTQLLAQQAQAVAGLQGLAERLRTDDAFRRHLQGYFEGQAQQSGPTAQQPQSQQQEGEPDPIDQIKAEAAQMAYERIKQEQQVQYQNAKQQEFHQAYAAAQKLKAEDPLAEEVQNRLNAYVEAQIHPLRKQETYQQLDQNPFFYLEMYRVLREQVAREKGGDPANQPQSQPQAGPQRTTRAPVLERGGAAPTTTQQSEARKKQKKLKEQALRSGSTDALANFLDSTGLIDSLL